MATIYRFIVEQRFTNGGQGRTLRDSSTTQKTSAKKGRSVSLFSNGRGGVEHNRKMRAINPLLNRMTGGWWERGMRLTRAGIGMGRNIYQNGAKGIFTGPALYIIIAFLLTTLLKWNNQEKVKADKANAQDFKKLENGYGAIHGQYKTTQNFWTGRITYNQNK